MPPRQRDVKVRILSQYYDEGSRQAERATRNLAAVQMRAHQEDIAREQARAEAIVRANRAQAEAMDHVGRRVLAMSAAIAIGLGLATKAAMGWESAFAGVRKVVDGSPEQVSQLEAELRGLAKVLPATHEEIAAVAEVAGQLGVARQDIAAFTRTAIDMGETTNMAAEEAATSMAQLSNIMGIAATESSRLGSAIVALGNNGASTERDIVSMALRIAGAGRTVGMTTAQVLGIASALASVGLEADAGGTAISRVILRIDRDVRSGASTLGTYARVSRMSIDEFATAWRDDATGALTQFITGLGEVQKQGGDTTAILTELGLTEVRVSDALRRAALAGDLMAESTQMGSRAWQENNALAEEAARRYETVEARLQVARNRINDTAIDIGAHFLPMVADAATGIADLAGGFQTLPEPVQEWTVKLGGAAAGLLGVVGGAAIAIPKLNALKETIQALHGGSSMLGHALGGVTSFLTGPWGLAIAGAVVAGGLWMANQGEIRRNVQTLTASLDEQTGAITENTRTLTVQRLQDRGVLEAAATLGLELDRVTDAALLNAGAMHYVEDAVTAAFAANDEAARNEQLTDAIVGQANAAALLNRQLLGQRAETQAAQREWQLQAEALRGAEDASGDAAAAAEELTAELDAQAELAEQASAAIDELAEALDDLNEPTLSARDAERAWYAQLEEVNAALEENGRTLDITTAAGRANQEVLDGLARTGRERANALLKETGSVEDYNTSLEASRQALLENALQFYDTENAAWAYVDSVLAIPDTATTQAILDTVAAEAQLAWFKQTLASNNVVITADLRTQGGYYANRAKGGIDYMAAGGIRALSPISQIIPPGTLRVAGDAPVPESWIPWDGSLRSRAIWQETGQRNGWSGAPQVTVVAPPAPSLRGLAIVGTLETPWGPSEIRGVVRDELADVGDRAEYAGVT